jgi:hypothetical protein
MVLGIWGIRSMLLGTDIKFFTAIDLALMVVIILLLVLISSRLLWRFGSTRRAWPWSAPPRGSTIPIDPPMPPASPP